MKTICLLLASIGILATVQAQQVQPFLQNPHIVNAPGTGSARPRIALVNDSVPLITWTYNGAGTPVVYVARWNGNGFNAPVPLSPSGLQVYGSLDEGGDIAAKGDTAFVTFFTGDSRSFIVRSVDGGVTWSDTVRIDHDVFEHAYTPDVAITSGGNPVVAFEGADSIMVNTGQLFCRSYDGGLTFTTEVTAHDSVNGIPCECCPPALLVQDSMVYILYRNNLNNIRNIVMTVSSDSGQTFPIVAETDQTNWLLMSCPVAGAEAFILGDSIVSVWKSGNSVYYGTANRFDGGEGSFNRIDPSVSATVIQRSPAVCGSGDTLFYVWSDRRTNNYDVYVAGSFNGVFQPSQAFIFNDTIGAAEGGTQRSPHAIYADGVLHLVYQNQSTDEVIYRRATVFSPVGIVETPAQVRPGVYPSPAGEAITISGSFAGTVDVQIYSATGALTAIFNNVNSGQQLNCANFESGMYFVQITDSEGMTHTSTFIKN
ncbi:MAG: T9SS type A sorting domain-containing protein [Bacteroidia bacterium]|nr:T9SS type A sorting domain-containing protein [Bacteroidia bacterium]